MNCYSRWPGVVIGRLGCDFIRTIRLFDSRLGILPGAVACFGLALSPVLGVMYSRRSPLSRNSLCCVRRRSPAVWFQVLLRTTGTIAGKARGFSLAQVRTRFRGIALRT